MFFKKKQGESKEKNLHSESLIVKAATLTAAVVLYFTKGA